MKIYIVIVCPEIGEPVLLGAFTDPTKAMKVVFEQEDATTVTEVTVTIYKA